MAGLLLVPGAWPVFDAAGDPVSGATISFFQPGTTTPKPVYSDDSLTTSLGSVLTTNAAGEPTTLGAVIAREWWASSGQVYDIRIQATGLDRSWNGIPAGSEGGGGSDDVPLITNVAVLRTTVWSPTRPDVIQLAYNHIPGDGGGFFRWDSASVLNDNNGGTRVKEDATLTGRWIRQINDGWVSVEWFGLVLSADEATHTANTTAMQRALNSGYNVRLPSGSFWCGYVTQSTAGQIVEGDRGRTVWRHPVAALSNLIEITSAAVGAIWRNFRVDGNSANVVYNYNASEFLWFATDVTIDNIEMKDCQSMGARAIGPAHRYKVTRCRFENCGDFGFFANNSGGDAVDGIIDGNTVLNFGLQGKDSVGLAARSAVGGTKMVNNSVTQTTVVVSPGFSRLGIEFWTNSNNSVIANNTVDMTVTGDFGLSCTGYGLSVTGNVVRGCISYGIEIIDRACAVVGNVIRSPKGAGIAINLNSGHTDPGDVITVTGNTIEDITTLSAFFAGLVVAGNVGTTPIAITVSGNTFHGTGRKMLLADDLRGFNVSGNTFYNTGSAEVDMTVGCQDGSITGNTFVRVSAEGTGNQVESITIGASCAGINISDNRFVGNSRVTNGIVIQSGASNIYVGPNHFSGILSNSVFSSSTAASVVVFGGLSNVGVSLNAANKAFGFINTTDNGVPGQNIAPSVGTYTVANLPTSGIAAAQLAYASNGRKNGEGSGAGTGVLVFRDGTAWRACDTGATVAS